MTWRNPDDASGVAFAYGNLEPPSSPSDGWQVTAAQQSYLFDVPAEGSYDLTIWLQDVAGNVSLDNAALLPAAARYDATAPEIIASYLPAANAAGWWRSEVVVTLDVEDAASGVASTIWSLDGQPPVAGTRVIVQGEGDHELIVSSSDNAGNLAEQTLPLRIDTLPPVAQLNALANYSASPQILVRWDGSDPGDPLTSSGVAGYDVQVRLGSGSWQPWLSGVAAVQGTYSAPRGRVVSFRARALDVAGNVSPWSDAGGRNSVFVDPVVNGSFATNNWTGWSTQDGLQMAIISDDDMQAGAPVPAARLGSRLYQACAASGPDMLPTPLCGDTWSGISQTIVVPSAQELARPTLEVWYRVQTYDQVSTSSPIWDVECPINPPPPFRWVDTFDIAVTPQGATIPDLLLRDGNTLPQFPEPIEFRDLGWQRATFDMRPYAGRTVTIDFSSHNRLDNRFNTWTDVTSIRLRGQQRQVFMPVAPVGNPQPPAPVEVCWPNGSGGLYQTELPGEMLPGAGQDEPVGSWR